MLLSDIIKNKNLIKVINFKIDKKIKYITSNSKLIRKDSILIVDYSKNFKFNYISEAVKKGAVAIVTNRLEKNITVPQFLFENLEQILRDLVLKLKKIPPKNIIGITGTNGKTSVVWLVSNIIKLSGQNVKSLGTLGYFKNLKKISDTNLTTPEIEDLYQYAFDSYSKKNEFVFEVSSHSISKKRIKNFPINIAAITNITKDHLDFHKTFEKYKKTKFILFEKYIHNNGIAIINDEIKGIKELKNNLRKKGIKIITYGKKNSDIYCKSFKKNKLLIKIFNNSFNFHYKLTADYEIKNLLCSIACCIAIGISKTKIINSIPKIPNIPGRMELVDKLKNNSKIYVDYAHSPDALKHVLKNYSDNKKPDLVFGCGGNRDKSKRALMGKIASQFANNIYLTDDNPRNENPEKIRNSIFSECKKALIIPDRKIAINKAIENLNPNSKLIIAGKGHEKIQIFSDKTIKFDDVDIAKKIIEKIKNKKTNRLKTNLENYIINSFNKLKINSNDVKKGDIFIALKGKKKHGNQFISKAIKKGAKFIITDKKIKKSSSKKIILVQDTHKYLSELASKKRNLFNGKVIGITGSIGKTSVKENLNFFLSKHIKVSSSIKSYNNLLGVTISILNLNKNSLFGIFEVGTNNFNEINVLSSILKPDQVVITNINPTHLENFKNTRNIAIEKSDLFNPKYNPNINTVILPISNKDEEFMFRITKKYKIKKVITFGNNKKANFYIKKFRVLNNFQSEIYLHVGKKIIKFKVPSSFEQHSLNIIISYIVFILNKIKTNNFFKLIKKFPIVHGRGMKHKLQIGNKKINLIDESYNASPTSMDNSINYFENLICEKNQKKFLVLGQMNELGKKDLFFHRNLVIKLSKTNIYKVIFCGNIYKDILNKITFNKEKFSNVSNENGIMSLLIKEIHNNDIILVKCSNNTKVNLFVQHLLNKDI